MQYCIYFVFKVQDNTYGSGVGLTKKEGKKGRRGRSKMVGLKKEKEER
jgi:hypothetical protein